MCTLEMRGNLFFLTLTGIDEHYLHPLIPSIRSALSNAKTQSTRGSVLITVAQGKFFSNGFVYPTSVTSSPNIDDIVHHRLVFKDLITELISLPMPTIAVITGHAIGGGLAFALCHDFVFMRRDRGILYMSEIDMGLSMPDYAFEVLKYKLGNPNFRRDIFLRGANVKADEGVKIGLVDKAYDSRESAIEGGVKVGEELAKKKWDGEVYAEIHKSLYPGLCITLGLSCLKLVVEPRI